MFTCYLPKAVYAGEDTLCQLPALLEGVQKVAIFSDRGIERSGVLEKPLDLLTKKRINVSLLLDLPSEPTCDQAQTVADEFWQTGAQAIVAIGGGSVMDVAKLCSILPHPRYTVRMLLDNAAHVHRQVRSVMIPTTFGTGSEATPNSIVAIPEKDLKVGIISTQMLPDAVILDADMVQNLPVSIAASTGMDALCHAIECYTSRKATPFSDLFSLEALRLIFAHLESACLDPAARDSKVAMQLAAFYGGAAITASGTTAVHALSYPLSGKYHIPHGIANAMLLLPVMRFNLENCRTQFGRIYDMLEQTPASDKAEQLLSRMESLVHHLPIPMSLKTYGISQQYLDTLAQAAMDVQRLLENNRRTVTVKDAKKIYQELLI